MTTFDQQQRGDVHVPMPATVSEIVRRGLRKGAVAGMWAAGAVAAIPCAVLLALGGGAGLLIAAIAVAIGALVGLIEGLVESLALISARGWVGSAHGRAMIVGAVSAGVLPAGVAVWFHTLLVFDWVLAFTFLAGAIAAAKAAGILWGPLDRAKLDRATKPSS